MPTIVPGDVLPVPLRARMCFLPCFQIRRRGVMPDAQRTGHTLRPLPARPRAAKALPHDRAPFVRTCPRYGSPRDANGPFVMGRRRGSRRRRSTAARIAETLQVAGSWTAKWPNASGRKLILPPQQVSTPLPNIQAKRRTLLVPGFMCMCEQGSKTGDAGGCPAPCPAPRPTAEVRGGPAAETSVMETSLQCGDTSRSQTSRVLPAVPPLTV